MIQDVKSLTEREGSQPQGVPLDDVLTKGESPWLQTHCSEENELQMALRQVSFYTLVESEFRWDMVM